MTNIICLLRGHDWKNDHRYPVYGFYDIPYPDSYCGWCKRTPQGSKVAA